jgi:hypothetical protein
MNTEAIVVAATVIAGLIMGKVVAMESTTFLSGGLTFAVLAVALLGLLAMLGRGRSGEAPAQAALSRT